MKEQNEPLIFSIPKPKNLEQEKALSNFKLKLSEYSNSISTDDNTDDETILFTVYPSPSIEKESLSEFIASHPYLGH